MDRKKVEFGEIRQKVIAIFILAVMFMIDLAPLSQATDKLKVVYYMYYNDKNDWKYFEETYAQGSKIKVPECREQRTGYTFLGWAEKENASRVKFKAGDEKNIGNIGLVCLYAVWGNTIRYNLNYEGAEKKEDLVVTGQEYKLTYKPERSGYTFLGWSTTPGSSTVEYEYGHQGFINTNMTLYAVWKKNASTGTNQSGSNSNSGSTVETQLVEVPITYYWEMWFQGDSSVDDLDKITKTKTINLKAEVGGYAEGVPPDVNECEMYVNGERVQNNNGKGTYSATEPKLYEVIIKWPTYGEDGWYKKTYDFRETIDKEPPSYNITIRSPEKTIQEGGSNGIVINIEAFDKKGLKSIKIGDDLTYDVKDGQKNYTAIRTITKPGQFKITVTDLAGNVCEKWETITSVDTDAPNIKSCNVEKVGKDTDNNDYVVVKSGDKIKITLKTDKNIRSLGAIAPKEKKGFKMTLNDISVGDLVTPIIDGTTITYELDIDEFLEAEIVEPGFQTIKLYGITDEYNNILEEYEVPTQLLIDDEPPEIIKFEITGGETTSDGKAKFIQNGGKLTFDIYMNEELSDDPTIKIAGKTYNVEGTPQKVELDKKTCYLYRSTIKSDDIINDSSADLNKEMLDGFIPVTIGNLVDLAKNKAEEYTYDNEKTTSNGIYLCYGAYGMEKFYIVSNENNSNNISKGDLNRDGYITGYDVILMNDLLNECKNNNKQISEDQKTIVDINYDGNFDDLDLSALREKVKNVKNSMYKDITKTFKVYTQDHKIVKGDDLKWTIYDRSGKDITNDTDKVKASYDASSGEYTFELVSSSAVKIEVYRETNKENEEEVGTLRLYNGITSWNAGIKVDNENKSGYKIMGDINNDGWVTTYDQLLVLNKTSQDNWDEDTIKRADMNGDGKVYSDDALMILRGQAGLGDGDKFHVIKQDDEITFHFVNIEWEEKWETVRWQIIYLNEKGKDAFEVEKTINDGSSCSCTIKAVGEIGAEALIKVEEEESGYNSFVYVKIDNFNIGLNTNEITYDLAEENKENYTITPRLNIYSEPLKITSEDKEIADIEIDAFGNVEVIPGEKTGKTKINFECDGKTETCTVNVVKGVNEIQIEDDITEIEINEGSSKDIGVTINEDATAEIEVGSADTSIAKIYYSKETGKYTIIGVNPGETEVEIYSKTDKTEIKKVIKVKVIEVKAPKINDIKWSQGNFKAGDQIALEFDFDEKFAGNEAPELIISFDNSPSKNNTVFKEFGDDNKSLRYLYTVAEGDNGTLRIDKLVGGNLTDVTGKYEIIKTRDNDYYKGSSTESNGENINYINDGIYKVIDAIKVDTTAPVLRIETAGSKHWLNTGDNIEVKIISTDALAKEPKVSFNGVEAKVEGENTTFTATLKVTDEIKEGYLEITVEDYEDEFGNEGEKLVAKTNNIDEPIIIDKSAPTVEVGIVKTESQDGNYKAGDKVQITLNFVNSGELGTMEYISTTEAPKLNLTFGDKTAQGKLTNNYEPGENSKNYTNKIVYEYEIAEGDKGDLKLQTIVGSVEDVAGNKTDLNIVYDNGGYYILSKDVDEDDELNDPDKQNDSTSGDTTNGSGKTNNQPSGDTTNGSGKTNNQSSGDTTNGSGKSNNQASGGTINSSDESNNQGAGDTADNSGSSISDWLWSYDDEDLSDDEFDYSYWDEDEDNYSGNANSFVNSYADLLPYTGLRIMGYIAILVLLACGDIGVYFFIKKKWY